MGDRQLSRSLDAQTSLAIYDYVLTPGGDWATVSGPAVLAQNVLLYIDTALGSHATDPLFGTTLQAQIGQTPHGDTSAYQMAIAECEAYFVALAAASPQTPLDEQMDHIENVQIIPGPGASGEVALTFRVLTRAGTGHEVATGV